MVPAEARVPGGILRGGHVDTNHGTFTYHCPHEVTVPLRDCTGLKLLDSEPELPGEAIDQA